MIRVSKSSPPRNVSPLVDLTSKTPSPISRIENRKCRRPGRRPRPCPSLLFQPIGERGRGRLVDDAEHLEPGDAPGVLRRLPLGVVEIGGDGDDRLRHRAAEIGLRGLLHLLKYERADLAWTVLLAANLDPGVARFVGHDLVRDHAFIFLRHRIVVTAPDQPFDGENGVFRIDNALAFSRLAHQNLTTL